MVENSTKKLPYRSLFISKKFFWFSDESLEHKHLSTYLDNEKADIAHRNAAHATQTGKGLLFFSKRAEDKGHPAGILNLVRNSGVALSVVGIPNLAFPGRDDRLREGNV